MNNDNINTLASSLVSLKQEIEEKKAQLKQLQESFDKTSQDLIALCESLEVDSFNAHGFTFYTQNKESVRIPKDEESKAAFFEWLKEQGLFDSMISVNSQTLNSLYRAKSEEALKEGVLDFRIPGIDEPTTYKQLGMRRSK